MSDRQAPMAHRGSLLHRSLILFLANLLVSLIIAGGILPIITAFSPQVGNAWSLGWYLVFSLVGFGLTAVILLPVLLLDLRWYQNSLITTMAALALLQALTSVDFPYSQSTPLRWIIALHGTLLGLAYSLWIARRRMPPSNRAGRGPETEFGG